MPNKPVISVVLPVFNAEKYLKEAIDSVLNQTFEDFELILINDGSTDDSLKIVQSYTDTRIQLIQNDQNLGLIKTLNKGIYASKGTYIARMDADDIAINNRFEIQVKYLNNHPNCVAVGSNVIQFGAVNQVTSLPLNFKEIELSLLFENCMAHPSVMIKSETVKKHQIKYREDLIHLEDWGLWLELLEFGEIHNIREPLLEYRIEGQNISVQNKSTLKERASRFYQTYLPKYFDRVNDEFIKEHWQVREGIIFSYDVNELTKRFQNYKSMLVDAGFNRELVDEFLLKKKEKLFYSLADQFQLLAIKFARRNKILDGGKIKYAISQRLERN